MSKLIKNIKLLSIIGASVFLLAGCLDFGGDTPPPTNENMNTYDTNVLSISIPKTWEILEQDDFTGEVPQETLVVFRNNVKNENFTANIGIVRKRLLEPLTSQEFAIMTNNRQSEGLPDYKEIEKNSTIITIGDKEDDTYLVVFEARKSADERLVKYVQIYGVKDNFGYIATGAVSPQESAEIFNLVGDSIKTFKLK